jgi:hypothetical protein
MCKAIDHAGIFISLVSLVQLCILISLIYRSCVHSYLRVVFSRSNTMTTFYTNWFSIDRMRNAMISQLHERSSTNSMLFIIPTSPSNSNCKWLCFYLLNAQSIATIFSVRYHDRHGFHYPCTASKDSMHVCTKNTTIDGDCPHRKENIETEMTCYHLNKDTFDERFMYMLIAVIWQRTCYSKQW